MFDTKIGENQQPMTGIAIRNGSTIKVVKEAKAPDGTDITGKIGKVIFINKDIVENGAVIDGAEVEESDTLDGVHIDVEFEEDCYYVPTGTWIVTEV